MENKLLGQYYNEVFKQELDPLFEELGDEDVKSFEKNLGNSLGFACWKFNKAGKEVGNAIKEAFQKMGILKIG